MVDCRSAGSRKHSARSPFFLSLGHVAYPRVRVCDDRQDRTLVRLFHHCATGAARICASFQPGRLCSNNFAFAIRIRTSPPFTFSQSHPSASSLPFPNTFEFSSTLGRTLPPSDRLGRFKKRHVSLRKVWISRVSSLGWVEDVASISILPRCGCKHSAHAVGN
jgi:hypothetical protein